jgi:hypothetical protein
MNKSGDLAGLHSFSASQCLSGRVFLGVVIEPSAEKQPMSAKVRHHCFACDICTIGIEYVKRAQAKDRHQDAGSVGTTIGDCIDPINRYLGSSSPRSS